MISKLKKIDKYTLFLFCLLIAIFAVMSGISPKFATVKNISSMAFQFSEIGMLSLAMMICMISGGIDISIVGTANLASIVAAVIMTRMNNTPVSVVLAIVMALVVGALCGVFNGLLIAGLDIPPMLVTLCGSQLFAGLGMAITKGPAITGLSPSFQLIGNGTVAGFIPISAIVFAVATVAVGFLLTSTVYGRHLCYMGSNKVASEYSGISNFSVTLKTYMTSGILASVAGLIMASHYDSAKPDYGSSYMLLALLIVVLGGVNPDGGEGKVLGVALAVIILQFISSSFNLLRINSFLKTFVFGLLLIVIVVSIDIAAQIKEKIRRKTE